MRRSRKSSSPTAARSPSASSARCASSGSASVAVYSEADRAALHVRVADEAYAARPGPAGRELPRPRAARSRRRAGRAPRRSTPATASSPRTPASRARSRTAGLVWIGPPPEAIEADGLEDRRARSAMQAAGVPIIPGTTEPVASAEEIAALGEELGYPLAIKAAAGGGGKGMKVVRGADEAERAFESARREGEAYFADPTVYVERYLEDPRHVEVQVLADAHGNVDPPRRARLHDPAPPPEARRGDALAGGRRRAARADRRDRRRRGARRRLPLGRDDRGPARPRTATYFFLEMNTRIQVEHTVTELVTGLDLVREQILVAAGEPLSLRQEDVAPARPRDRVPHQRRGSRRPASCPRPGGSRPTASPAGPGVRVDSGVDGGLRGLRALRPDDREADRPRRRPRARAAADAARARRVRDRRRRRRWSASTARCSRTRASSRARRATASSSRRSWRGTPSGSRATPRRHRAAGRHGCASACRRRARRPPLRGHGARPEPPYARARRAAGGSAAAAGRRAAARATPSSARCRARCSRSRVAEGDEVERRAGDLHRRGDEDGERDHRAPRRRRHRALGRGRRAGRDRPGDLRRRRRRRMSRSVRAFCSAVSPGDRRAARRDRQPDRPLDPRRVPRPLGPRRARRQRPLRRGQGAPARAAQRSAAREAALRPKPERRAAAALRVFFGTSPERGGAPLPRRGRRLRGPARRSTSPAPRRAARPSAPRRLHARQARPLLRARTAGRSTTRSASRPTTTGSGSRRTSAATASPATSSSCPRASTSAASARDDAWPVLDEYLAGRIDLDRYRGRSRYAFPVQAAEHAVREATGLRGIDDLGSSSPDGATCTLPLTRRQRLRGRRRRRAGRAHLPDVRRRAAQAPAALRRRKPSRTSRRTRTSRPSSSRSPGSSAARERLVGAEDRVDLGRACPGSSTCLPSNESVVPSRSAITVVAALDRRVDRQVVERAELLQAGRRASAGGCSTKRAPARATTSSGPSRPRSRSSRSAGKPPSFGDRAAEARRRPRTRRARPGPRRARCGR